MNVSKGAMTMTILDKIIAPFYFLKIRNTSYDKISRFKDSLYHHGKMNNRVFIIKTSTHNPEGLINHVENLANEYNYTKIIFKVPEPIVDIFDGHSYLTEGIIPKYYKGNIACHFKSKFLTNERGKIIEPPIIKKILKDVKNKPFGISPLNHSFDIKKLHPSDIPNLCMLYKMIFKSYPFPIFEEAYIAKTMNNSILYFGAFQNNNLVGASSAEIDYDNLNAEMTDFATNPNYLGKNISAHLLKYMEEEMRQRNIKTCYTIARSVSFGMNSTFHKLSYVFSGTLVNNTNICGNIESMNVWYKHL